MKNFLVGLFRGIGVGVIAIGLIVFCSSTFADMGLGAPVEACKDDPSLGCKSAGASCTANGKSALCTTGHPSIDCCCDIGPTINDCVD